MNRRDTRGWLACVVVATLVAVGVGEAQSPEVDVVLDRLGAYLLNYESTAFELAADERYEQRIKRRREYGGATVGRRKLSSTYFLVRLPDGQAWYGFRDVATVDGRAVTPAKRSMAELLSERTVTAYEEAIAITHENAKYNIGGVYRTINVPLQALELLHPRHRKRFEFRAAGRERVKGQETVVIAFNELSAPTLIGDGFGGDLLSHGRVWVDPVSGTVVRTELSLAAPYLKEMAIRVDYQRDSRLQLFVPTEMEETYGLDAEVLHGSASYRNYRRFETAGRLVTQPE